MNLIEISEKFADELDAIKFFEGLRWGKKVTCAYCGSDRVGKRQRDFRFFCKSCSRSFSVTTATRIHDTRLPLRKWLFCTGLIIQAKKGLSAHQLARDLGVHYETAWNMYRIVREAIGNDEEKLDGVLEMDETYVGGKPRKPAKMLLAPDQIKGYDKKLKQLRPRFKIAEGSYKKPKRFLAPKRGRGTEKIPVVGIVQRHGDVIAEVMEHLTGTELKDMVKAHVNKKKSIIITDEYRGYNKLDAIIEHIKIDHQRMWSYRGLNTNTIESFWAILKRALVGQYHQVSPEYLPDYVNEIVFKYNYRENPDQMFDIICKKLITKK